MEDTVPENVQYVTSFSGWSLVRLEIVFLPIYA